MCYFPAMSVPMSRTISRPFGRAANTASINSAVWQPTESSGSVPSFVLQDAPDDTPHDIHPHAAAYFSSQQPSTGLDSPGSSRTLRQMSPAERSAWMQSHGPRSPAGGPPPVPTASSGSAPSMDAPAAEAPQFAGQGRDRAAWRSGGVYPDFPPQSPGLGVASYLDVEMTASTGSAPSRPATPTPDDAPATPPPARTSSLQRAPTILGAVTEATGGRASGVSATPELEIVISRVGGQDITLRLFAPAR